MVNFTLIICNPLSLFRTGEPVVLISLCLAFSKLFHEHFIVLLLIGSSDWILGNMTVCFNLITCLQANFLIRIQPLHFQLNSLFIRSVMKKYYSFPIIDHNLSNLKQFDRMFLLVFSKQWLSYHCLLSISSWITFVFHVSFMSCWAKDFFKRLSVSPSNQCKAIPRERRHFFDR